MIALANLIVSAVASFGFLITGIAAWRSSKQVRTMKAHLDAHLTSVHLLTKETPVTLIPPVPPTWIATVKQLAADVAKVGAGVGAVLAVVLNVAPSIHLPAQDIAIIVAASSIVTAIVAQASSVANDKLSARRAAKQ